MIRLSEEAERQLGTLLQHYTERNRPEASQALIAALDEAILRIEANPAIGLPARRPYPSLARPDRLWTKTGRYWIAYCASIPPVILAIFYDTVDLPGRA